MAVCTDERDVYVRCVNDVAVSQTCVCVCVCVDVSIIHISNPCNFSFLQLMA